MAAALLIAARVAPAQATATVPPNDPVYEFIDRLIGLGVVDSAIVGQRPLSRREIGRILDRAASKPSASTSLVESLARYRRVYGDTRRPGPPAYVPTRLATDVFVASSASRGIPADGNGAIDVDLNPLLANQLGVRHVDGVSNTYSATWEVPLRPWLAASATGHAALLFPRGVGTSNEDGRIDQLYARALFRNVGLTAGRDYVFFGQGMSAGLTNSLNPRGFDMVRVSSEHPFVLPSFLRLLGPVAGTAFLADLGAGQRFPHTRLFNWRVSARPFSALEVGAGITDQMGGQGAPGGTLLQKIEDVFPLLDATILHRVLLFSNKFFGVDARLRVPHTRGLQLYMEGALDDFDLRRLKSSLTEDGGYIWGASFACFTRDNCGSTTVTAEYHVTGLRYFTHGIFTSGYTLDRQFIGDQLGPRGKALYVDVDLDQVGRRFKLDLAHEIRSGDLWGATSTTANDSDFRFILLNHRPTERRWRSVLTATIGHPADWITVNLSGGAERVDNFNFRLNSWRTNGIGQIAAVIRPASR